MLVWRLCRRAHAAFDGEGARRFGGRWNHRGTALVYTSGDAALAVLEYFVNLEAEDAPGDLVLIHAEIPESVTIRDVRVEQLRGYWRTSPAPERLARIGTDWAAGKTIAVLSVPSAVVPVGRNYLLNPMHAEFAAITVGRPRPFTLDSRLLKKRGK
jgi:RES domain-containing protein